MDNSKLRSVARTIEDLGISTITVGGDISFLKSSCWATLLGHGVEFSQVVNNVNSTEVLVIGLTSTDTRFNEGKKNTFFVISSTEEDMFLISRLVESPVPVIDPDDLYSRVIPERKFPIEAGEVERFFRERISRPEFKESPYLNHMKAFYLAWLSTWCPAS